MMNFTIDQIRAAIYTYSLQNDMHMLYAQASRFGVIGVEIDAAMNMPTGFFDGLCISNGWAILGRLPPGVMPGLGPVVLPTRVRVADEQPALLQPEDPNFVPRLVDEDLDLQAHGSDGG
jgi:hypothetical protein